jgi:nucleoside phosphorylase
MNFDILFVAAEPRECEPFLRHWMDASDAHLRVHWSRAGKWNGRKCVVVANGAGAERAKMAVTAAPAPVVCSIGLCGALDTNLQIGDIFVASEVRNGVSRWQTEVPAPRAAAIGPLQTAPRIIATGREKSELRAAGSLAVDMEASGVARASEETRAAFYCIRAVSDLANETFVNDFNACLMPDGRFNTGRLVRRAILSPSRMRELIRLAGRASIAAKNLGEYLACCEF